MGGEMLQNNLQPTRGGPGEIGVKNHHPDGGDFHL
jgi:hypothetical protein